MLALMTDAPATLAEFDALFAENVGPRLRLYVTARLHERGDRTDADGVRRVLAELYTGLAATDAFVGQLDLRSFGGRLYGIVDAVLPHLDRPGVRRAPDPELVARGEGVATAIAEAWHGGWDDALARVLALEPREREAVLLRDYHLMAMHELARRLDLPVEEARAFVAAARDKARGSVKA